MRHTKFMRRTGLSAFALTLIVQFSTSVNAEKPSAQHQLTLAECWRALDRAVLHANDVDSATAQQGFTSLAQSCESLPQVHHNLGVMAARRGQWEPAIRAFERAIELEPLTADTVDQLHALHEYQAKQAWQMALQTDNRVKAPRFNLQTSSDQNQVLESQPNHDTGLRSVTTLDFELYTWWHALVDTDDKAAWLDHYVNGYPAQILPQSEAVDWDDVRRDIRFTAQDAVAVLSWDHAGKTHHRMLLLNLTGLRWKIYHEASL